MPDVVRKKRMISIRLSEMEYEVLRTQYGAYGARSVSDLARLALHRILAGPVKRQDGLAAKVSELDDRLHALESSVALLREGGGVMACES
jgi:hypothetical protein